MSEEVRMEVAGCFDCPFAHLDDQKWSCAYPTDEKVIPITRWGRLRTIPALNCPLKNESIKISIKP